MEDNNCKLTKTALFDDLDISDFTLHLLCNQNAHIIRGRKRKLTANDNNKENVEKIRVSKATLSLESIYFHRMFKSGVKEVRQSEATIEFESERERDTFKHFIRFIYTKEIADNADLKTFLKLADRFDCYEAVTSAVKKMPDNLTVEDCCEWLDMLILYKEKQEIQDAIKKIEESLVTHFYKFDFKKDVLEKLPQLTSKNAAILLLGSDLLTPFSENEIFRAAYEWHFEHKDKVNGLSELASVFRWKYMSVDFLNCIKLLPEMDKTLLCGIIDALTSRFVKNENQPNKRKVLSDEAALDTHLWDTNMENNEKFLERNGFEFDIGVNVRDHQLTFTISKIWPPLGECTLPLRALIVNENGDTKEYELKDVLLKERTMVSLNVVHQLNGNPKLSFKLVAEN